MAIAANSTNRNPAHEPARAAWVSAVTALALHSASGLPSPIMPEVSALMVLHRDQPFLRPAVAAILAQTFRDLELILVDNGAHLPEEALGESRRDPRIRWVRLPRNEGIPAGHNAGVAAATGEFIALLDYDDITLPRRLERQVELLRSNRNLGLVSALAERIDAEGRAGGLEFCLLDPAAHRAYTQFAAAIVTPVATGRREMFAALPYRPEFPFAGDIDFQARAIEGWEFAVLPEVLLRYRWYAAQTTQRRSAEIECSRSAIQLVTARRRAGREEDLPGALSTAAADSVADGCRRTAAQAIAEGLSAVAAYQARRSFAVERTLRSAAAAARLAWRALLAAPSAERRLAARIFLTGPVRALGLNPVGRNTDGPAGA